MFAGLRWLKREKFFFSLNLYQEIKRGAPFVAPRPAL